MLPDVTVLTEPAKAEVLHRLDGCVIAHFACHAATDPADPSRSGLVLADGPLTVADLASVRLSDARLAYLSACGTAISGAEGLADEAIHITSAFQLAGFPHVVGTLWPVIDEVASAFAVTFHAALGARAARFEPARTALALHETANQARAWFPAHPMTWAGYIHVGA
jgi:CHAT domain-containing protein